MIRFLQKENRLTKALFVVIIAAASFAAEWAYRQWTGRKISAAA